MPNDFRRAERLDAENEQLKDILREALAMLEIYYVPNSDGSTPIITRIKQALAEQEHQ